MTFRASDNGLTAQQELITPSDQQLLDLHSDTLQLRSSHSFSFSHPLPACTLVTRNPDHHQSASQNRGSGCGHEDQKPFQNPSGGTTGSSDPPRVAELTLMLLVGGVAEAHGDEDEEDEEGPDDLRQQLQLEHRQQVLSITFTC